MTAAEVAVATLVRMRDKAQEKSTTIQRGYHRGEIRYPTRWDHGYADALEDAIGQVQDALKARNVLHCGCQEISPAGG